MLLEQDVQIWHLPSKQSLLQPLWSLEHPWGGLGLQVGNHCCKFHFKTGSNIFFFTEDISVCLDISDENVLSLHTFCAIMAWEQSFQLFPSWCLPENNSCWVYRDSEQSHDDANYRPAVLPTKVCPSEDETARCKYSGPSVFLGMSCYLTDLNCVGNYRWYAHYLFAF